MKTDAFNTSTPPNDYPLRGNMIFKFKRDSFELTVTECTFF